MKRFLEILLLLGLMATSGMPLFIDNMPVFVVYFTYTMVCAVYFRINIRGYLTFLLVLSGLLFVQLLYFGIHTMTTMIAQLMIVSTAIITLGVLNEKFLPTFIQIMQYIAIISLVLFVPIMIKPSIADLMIANSPIHFEIVKEPYGIRQVTHSLLFINFTPDFPYRARNIGPFWEAGVYGGFLVISLVINTILEKAVFTRRGILFLITILTTFSTTAYLALLAFLGIYYAVKIASPLLRAISIVIFSLIMSLAYSQLEFLGTKISDELEMIAYDAQIQGGNSRMASAYLDITELDERNFYIFFGRGFHPENRFESANKAVQRNNGVTGLLVVWGVPFFIAYILLLSRSFKAACRYFGEKNYMAWLFVIILLILGQSEPYFGFGFFWALILLYVPYELKNRLQGPVVSYPK